MAENNNYVEQLDEYLENNESEELHIGTPLENDVNQEEEIHGSNINQEPDGAVGVALPENVQGSEDITGAASPESEQRENVGRGARERREPYWKKDYVCKSMRLEKPITNALHSQSNSSQSSTRYPLVDYVITDCFPNTHRSYLAKLDEVREPGCYREAAGDPKWRKAMHKEITALENNGTWKVVNLPIEKKPIGCKWVYKVRYRADGTYN